MKLSFSTKGWHDQSWPEMCAMAAEMGLNGIELHNIRDGILTAEDGPLNPNRYQTTLHKLRKLSLEIPCINTICDFSDEDKVTESIDEICRTIDVAAGLSVP